MIYVVKYLLVFNMVIAGFLTLRMSEWICQITPMLAFGDRSGFLHHMNERKSFRVISVRAGTIGLLILTGALINWSHPVAQFAGLMALALILVWRWLYFVKHAAFAFGALAIALIMPILVIAKGALS